MRHVQLLELWRRDPVAWAHDVLDEPPYPRQEHLLGLYAENDWTAATCCRNWGKTRAAAIHALHWLTTRPDSLVFTTAPRWRQVTDGIWRNIASIWRRSKLPTLLPSWEVLQNRIKTPSPQWYAVGVASARVEDIEGNHDGGGGTLVILDESKGVPDAFFNSLLGMISRGDVQNKVLAIGTPGIPRGWFYQAFGPQRARWAALRGSAYDVPELRAHAEAERERLGDEDPFFRQQQLAEFSMAEGNVVIPLSLIERAVRSREQIIAAGRSEREAGAHHVVSLDPAGGAENGDGDECVLGDRVGGVLVHAESWQFTPGQEERTAERAFNYAVNVGARTLAVDEPGVGLIVCRVIEQLIREWQKKVPGNKMTLVRYKPSIKARNAERYQNRKSEDVFLLRDRFREGRQVIPDIPDLIGQLCSWTYTDTRTSKTEVIDPSDSPDWADMLNINCAVDREFDHVRGVRARGI